MYLTLFAIICIIAHMCNWKPKYLGAAVTVAALPLCAQPIAVPNFSFESQTAPSSYPFVNINVDSWQKIPEPAYFGPIGSLYGIPWAGTAGVFLDVNPYVNHVGNQAGYILGFPQVSLFQDYSTSPTHDFNATFEVGNAYNLTVGVFGKPTLTPGATLELSLYYLDGQDNRVAVGSTTITYNAADFPTAGPLSLIDFSVNVPTVQVGDAWAGQHIGIELESTVPLNLASGGNWDFDNVRLSVVPEPATASLLALGAGAMLLVRPRSRRPA